MEEFILALLSQYAAVKEYKCALQGTLRHTERVNPITGHIMKSKSISGKAMRFFIMHI